MSIDTTSLTLERSTRGYVGRLFTREGLWFWIAAGMLLALFLVVKLIGRGDGIDSDYGRRSGVQGGASVNGTAVLAGMFEAAGHQVSTTGRLSPRVFEKADCIVWAPDDFQPPTVEVRQWFEQWWAGAPDRTLIYIGRDYDAAPDYWRTVVNSAAVQDQAEMKRRQAAAQNDFLTSRARMPASDDCGWFTCERQRRPRRVQTLAGKPDWLSDVDPTKVQIELNGRLLPPAGAETWLQSQGDVLVSRQQREDGQLILVVNGSLVLNEPLVNHENRKLAAKLVDAIGPPCQHVVFLESGAGGPPVWNEEPREHQRTGLDILGIWPFSLIFLHLVAVGLLFCYSRYPIFGRPRPLEAPPLADFGRHVAALGTLLERTRDRAYALNRLAHYQQAVRREPGRFRRSSSSATSTSFPSSEADHESSRQAGS